MEKLVAEGYRGERVYTWKIHLGLQHILDLLSYHQDQGNKLVLVLKSVDNFVKSFKFYSIHRCSWDVNLVLKDPKN